jgi:hypothetical protein
MSNTKAELKPGEYIEESKEFTLDDFKRVEREMNKLTKEEIQELKILMTRLEEADFEDAEAEDENEVEIDIRKWVEQKKKQWMELAVAEYKLKKEMETKFYGSGLDLN